MWAVDRKVEVKYHTYTDVGVRDFARALLREKLRRHHENVPTPTIFARLPRATASRSRSRRFCATVNEFLADKRDYMVVAESGDMLFGGLDIRVPHNNAYFAQGFYASMGFAVPAALGAQIGSGLRPLVMCGDGGFQMTGPEISQAPAKGVNPIVVLINNGGWGIFRPIAERRELLEIPPWPYAQLARDWGGEGFEATTVDQLRDALRAAHDCKSFAIIDVQGRARRPVSGDGEVHQGGGEALAGAGRASGAREFARMSESH